MLARGTLDDGKAGVTRGAVLIADDDPSIRMLVRRALEDEGWRVLEAGDGAAALSVYEREAPAVALVLLDLTMPVMSGAQFGEHYRKLRGANEPNEPDETPSRHAPVVVFTAAQGLRAAQEAERLRAAGFITKPFDLDDLLAVVERCARPVGEASSVAPVLPSSTERMSGSNRDDSGGSDPGAPAAPGVSGATGKLSREEIARQQQIDRLRTQLSKIQEEMGKVRSGVTQVTQIESARRLTREEARWASQLRMESERLRYELQLVRDEFYRIKDERARRPPAPR